MGHTEETDARQVAIDRLHLLERAGDPALEAITRLAAHITGAAAAAIHVLDRTHQRRIVATGAPLRDDWLADSMCRLVLESGAPVISADATLDPRFIGSPYVRGNEPVRFYASIPLCAYGGQIVGTMCAFDPAPRRLTLGQVQCLKDLAAQAQAHIELMTLAAALGHAATLDPLTGAVNRFVFDDRLTQALTRAHRHGQSVLLAILDVDSFKTINDTYGHPAGDELLREIARRLRAIARAEDTVARLGGDEFALIAEVTPAGRQILLDRLRDTLGPHGGLASGATVTIGSVMAQANDDATAVVARADRAMYAAKGRLVSR